MYRFFRKTDGSVMAADATKPCHQALCREKYMHGGNRYSTALLIETDTDLAGLVFCVTNVLDLCVFLLVGMTIETLIVHLVL